MVLTTLGVCPPYMETSPCNKGEDWLVLCLSLSNSLLMKHSQNYYMKMSSQLTSLVSSFDGSNYGLWSKSMKAFLMSQGLWSYVDGSTSAPIAPIAPLKPSPLDPNATTADRQQHADDEKAYKEDSATYVTENTAFLAAMLVWNKANDMALGSILLRLAPSLQQQASNSTQAEQVWDTLENQYGTPTIPMVYKDFKEVITIRFNPNQHPAAQLNKMATAFQQLSNVTIGSGHRLTWISIPPQLQAMIALAPLPSKWEHLVQIIINGTEMDQLTFRTVREALVAQWDMELNRGGHKNTQNANKISAVKRKHGDPRFNQQQGGSQQRTDDSGSQRYNQHSQRGKGKGKGKDKGKQRANNP